MTQNNFAGYTPLHKGSGCGVCVVAQGQGLWRIMPLSATDDHAFIASSFSAFSNCSVTSNLNSSPRGWSPCLYLASCAGPLVSVSFYFSHRTTRVFSISLSSADVVRYGCEAKRKSQRSRGARSLRKQGHCTATPLPDGKLRGSSAADRACKNELSSRTAHLLQPPHLFPLPFFSLPPFFRLLPFVSHVRCMLEWV